MVNLSVGLGYVHHGFKRQADNRQYLIMQGLACIFDYAKARSVQSESERREARYTVARVFHMLGLHHLAHEGYSRVLNELPPPTGEPGDQDTVLNAAFNQYVLLMTAGDGRGVETDVLPWLVL